MKKTWGVLVVLASLAVAPLVSARDLLPGSLADFIHSHRQRREFWPDFVASDSSDLTIIDDISFPLAEPVITIAVNVGRGSTQGYIGTIGSGNCSESFFQPSGGGAKHVL